MLTMHSSAFPALRLSRRQRFCLTGFRLSVTWNPSAKIIVSNILQQKFCLTYGLMQRQLKQFFLQYEYRIVQAISRYLLPQTFETLKVHVIVSLSRELIPAAPPGVLTSGGMGSMPAQFSLHLSKTRRSFRKSTDSMRRCSWSFPSRSWWVGGWYVTPLGSCGGGQRVTTRVNELPPRSGNASYVCESV